MNKASTGFTLLETLIVLVIASILTAMAIPSFNELIANNRTTAYRDLLLSDIFQSRSYASGQGEIVSICAANSAGTACSAATDWQLGWIVFNDIDGDLSIDAGDSIIKKQKALAAAISTPSATTNLSALSYDRSGFLQGAVGGTITFCHQNHDASRKVIVNGIGRPAIDTTTGDC